MKSRELYVVDLMIKLCERLISKQPLNFNNFIIIFDNKNNITISQMKQAKKIQLFFKLFIKEQYVAQRAREAYIVIVL